MFHQRPRLVAFIRLVHDQMPRQWWRRRSQQLPAFRRVARLASRQRERQRMAFIRRDQMDLGRPAPARLADRLRPVFFKAPVPSGCTFDAVLSSEAVSA